MRPPQIKFFVFFLTLMLLLLSSGLVWATEENDKKEEDKKPEKKVEVIKTIKHVVVIGLDGMDSKDLAGAPNLNGLASMGVKVPQLIPVKPEKFPVTVGTLLTGLEPGNHGYIKKGDKLSGTKLIDIYQKSNRKVLFVDGTSDGLKDLGSLSKLYRGKLTEPKAAVQEIIKTFPKEQPYLTSLFLTVDGKAGLKVVDREVGRLFNFLHQQGVYEYTLFVVTGVKGFDGFAAYKGPGVKGGITETSSRLVDIFPTLIKVTDGTPPEKVDGLVLWNILKAGDGYSEANLLQKRVNELSASQGNLTKALYLAKEDKRIAQADKKSIEQEKGKVLETVGDKDKEIKNLKLKIGAMKIFGFIMVVGFGIGYIIEYFVLRKKFLMF